MGNVFHAKQSTDDPERWLNHQSRCFGDKGDVEDITEGPFTLGRTVVEMLDNHYSRVYLADIISTVEFDHTGNYLATGDKGGRVVLFERNETVSDLSLEIRPFWTTASRRTRS